MSDVVGLGRRVSNLDLSPQFVNYSKVVIHIDNETAIEAGNDTGRTLELDNPFGTQQMAQDILDKLSGYQYQPYHAQGALLDPAAEIGDAASMRGNYGGIYTRSRTFGRLMKADISAPTDEEIDHEYKFEIPEKREFARQIDDVKASLIIANNRIDASVSQTGGNNQSFGWSLLASEFGLYANNRKVFYVNADGAHVDGEVTATSGKIGGFTIGASSLYNNLSSYGGTQTSGVYVGTDGIQLGQNFKVDTKGELTATNMVLLGTLWFKDGNGRWVSMNANNLRSGAESAYNNSSYWTGGAGGGYSYNAAAQHNSDSYPSGFTCGTLYAKSGISSNGTITGRGLSSLTLSVGGNAASWQTKTISGVTIRYLGR